MQLYYLATICFAFALIFGFHPYQSPKTSPPDSHQSTMPIDYQNEHNRVINGIMKEFGISPEVWDRYMQNFKNLVAGDNLLGTNSSTKESKDLITRLLQEYGIDPAVVKVTFTRAVSQAESLQDVVNNRLVHTLSINPDWFKTLSLDRQEAIVRHEIQHLLNYDCIEEMYIRWILTDLGFTKKQWEKSPAMIAYYHMRELRADAHACANNPKVAQSLHDYFLSCVSPHESSIVWDSHPSDSYRAQCLALAHNLSYTSVA